MEDSGCGTIDSEQRNAFNPTKTTVLSIAQRTEQEGERLLLSLLMDDNGRFDIVQFGSAISAQNLIFLIRSATNPDQVTKVREVDLIIDDEAELTNRLAEACEME